MFGQRALEPISARTGGIDKDERRAFGLQRNSDEYIDSTVAGTKVAKGEDRGVVVLGDRDTGNGLCVAIQTDVEYARLVQG
jgi:hypothetical protein